MEFIKTYQGNLKPTVFLFSEPISFSLYLVEKLLSNLCRVVVFSANPASWIGFTAHITKTDNLIFDSQKNFKKYLKPNYFLIVDLLNRLGDDLINRSALLSDSLDCKGFVIVSENKFKSYQPNLSESVGVICLDNLFGPRMELNNEERISQIIGAAVRNEMIKIYENEKIAPVYMGDAAKLISKWLFSFGPYGEVASISTTKMGVEEICKIVKNIYPNFKYHVEHRSYNSLYEGKKNTYLLERGSNVPLEETLLWFKRNVQPKSIATNRKDKSRWAFGVLASILIILATPFIFVIIAISSLFLSKEMVVRENFTSGRFLMETARITSGFAGGESKLLTSIPVLDRLYVPVGSISYIVKNTSLVGLRGFDLISEAYLLSDNILRGGDYNLKETQDKIVSNLNYVGTTLSFIESDAKNYPTFFKRINFDSVKETVSNASKIIVSLSDLLGVEKTKTYLVLFQNNMELRPTGGFIGSFALVSFNAGKLGEVSVQDVYSADGQLKGHIEPPQPIKKYLKEANWFLRDSNWDPDFPTSAARAEWFLDKEIDIPVDGVIALDLNMVKDLLREVGPIYLSDYQMQVSSDNFYEKTQAEVEAGFFAGSTKKASFITALAKEMINTLVLNKDENKANLAKIIYENLQERHIQIFLHNSPAKEALASLNWDGSFDYKTCNNNCFSDFVAPVEANMGVNKSNYYIERKYVLSVELGDRIVKKILAINYKNNADLAMGNKGIYKVYSRLGVPPTSEAIFVKVGDNQLQPDIETVSGRKEVGYYFELPPGQTKTVNVSWQIQTPLSFSKTGEYLIYLRKQAGTSEEPISINFNTSSGVALTVEPGYNTLFGKDINSKVTWKK